jgi:hypothetical protein
MKEATVLLKQDIGVRRDNVVPFRETAAIHQIPLAPPPVPQNPSPYFEVEDEGLVEDFRLPAKYVEDEPILMEDEINVALRFADRAKFFEMCEASLWGDEEGLDPNNEYGQKMKQLFGEMLRGLVIQFKPRNEMHLHLLSNIADAQWELERIKRYKKSVYTQNEKKAGSNGMRAGTELGFSLNKNSDSALDRLNKAIDVYLKAIKRV